MRIYTKLQALSNSMRTDEEGATAVEYGLMVSLIAVAIIVAVTALGGELTALFTRVTTAI